MTEKGRRLLEAGRRRRLARLTRSLGGLPAAKLALLHEAAELMIAMREENAPTICKLSDIDKVRRENCERAKMEKL